MERIDRVVRRTVDSFGNVYFTKPEAMNQILADQSISNVLQGLPRRFPGWQLDRILTEYIQSRLDRYLQRQVTVTQMQDGPVKMRVFENYPVGQGPRRWKRLDAMTIDDLRISIATRRRQVAAHQRVIRVYEALITLLEGMPAAATVGDAVPQLADTL